MAHRDVSISLFGIMAGVLLGAGSLALVHTSSMDATIVSYVPDHLHPAALSTYDRRTINKKGIPLRADSETNLYPTIKTESSSSVAAVVTGTAATPCASVQAAIAKIQDVYNAITPVNVSNTETRQKMTAAFADALDDYCDMTVYSSSSAPAVQVTPTAMINNHCGLYPTYTARYSQCVINQGLGRKFP